ncbi:hypothetical protein V2K98_01985 [Pseudomonas alliivorans]|nr:hypothetical protein [Pseudomonas alliivorans]
MEKTLAAKHASNYRQRKGKRNRELGIEILPVEVSIGMTQGLQCLMREHGFTQRQEVYQTLLRHVLSVDFEEAARILRPVTSVFAVSPKLARQFRTESLKEIHRNPGDETITPEINEVVE